MEAGNSFEEYFKTYGDLAVHRTMLMDEARNKAYWKAVLLNKPKFKGKVVLDVGAGTGILSVFCAQAGAKKVYAVEGSEALISILKSVVKDNGFEDIIEVIFGEIETAVIPEKVDILISEWMGHFLLHEGMLDSVLSARRRFLRENGTMIPEKASMYIALCDVPELARNWTIVKGVNLSAVTVSYRIEAMQYPAIEHIKDNNIISNIKVFKNLDLYSVESTDLEQHTIKTVFVCNKEATVEGICIWWDVLMDDKIVLSTSPSSPLTHWKQTVIYVPVPIEVTNGTPICVELTLKKEGKRRYEISLTLLDPKSENHDIPCDCILTKCMVTKAYFYEASVAEIQDVLKNQIEEPK